MNQNQESNEMDNDAMELIKAKDWYLYFRIGDVPIIIWPFLWTHNLFDIYGNIMFDTIICLN